MPESHPVRVGVGGWIFDAWDETFYPPDLPKRRQLAFAAEHLEAIEINSTFYRLQSEKTFASWAAQTPKDFFFTVKAHRFCTSRATPDAMQDAIGNFLDSGVTALGEKLGPINWQFLPTRKFDADYFEAFCARLPPAWRKRPLHHAIEVRHESFNTPAFGDILRRHGCAVVSADDDAWPMADLKTADFAYARLQKSKADEPEGYPRAELMRWAKTFRTWAQARPVFVFFISGAKARNPAAAMALARRLKKTQASLD